MEAETNSPEDASSKSVPLVKSIINIGNEEIIFPQKLGTEVNSEYPLVEEKGKADRKTDEVSEIRPQEIHQESCEVCVGSEKQAEVPSDWLKQRDSEGLVMTESIPKSSEHEHEPMSTIPELAINHSEMAEKICEEETYNEEEESTEIDDDKSCRPENDLGKRSKALEAIDQTQFMGKDTAVNEHADHQSEAPSMENVITKHSNSEEKLLAESSIKSNYEEEPLQKILELYSVDNSEIKIDGKVMPEKEIGVPADGTLKTLSTTECIGAEELEKKDEGKFAHEKAKEMEAATEMQLLERASADSPPEEEVQPRLPTPDIVQQKTDQIIKQQSLNEDQPDVIDNAKSCIAENELDRVSTVIEEPVQLETKDNISIVKEQADQQSEETSMQSVTTNYIIEGHVISESTTKLTDDVHESHSIKNLERKDANEIREEATDVKQSIRKTEAKGISEDKALQTLFSAELVGSKTVEERCQEDIKPEAQLAVTYANEEQTPQHEFDTKKEIPEEEACQLTAENEPKSEPQIVAQNNETTCIKHPYLNGETAEINPTSDTVEQEITMSHTKEKLAIEDDKKFNLEEVQGTVKETKMQLQDTTTESVSKEEPIQPIARAGSVRTEAHDESSSEEIQPEANVTEKSNKEVLTSHVTEKEGIWDNGKCSQVEEAKTIEEPTKMQLQEEEVQTRSPTPASVEGDTNQIWQQEALYIDDSEVNDNAKQGYIPKIAQDIKLTIAQETEKPETMDNVRIVREKLDNKDVSDIRLQEGTDAKQLTDVEISKSETEGVSKDEAQQPITNRVLVGTEVVDEGSQEEKESEADVEVLSNKEEQRPEYVTGGTVEINTTSYTNENEEVPTSSVSAKEGIENDGKFSKEGESKGVEEKTKMQKQKSPTPAFVKGDTYQIPQQETLYIDSEVFDNAKQWCIPAIELDKKTTVVQETSNPETKDKVSVEAENLDHKDATEIKAEEGTYAQQLTDVEMLKSEREGMPIDEAQQPIANAVLVGSEALDESSQEEIPPQTYLKEKSNKEVPTPEYVTDEVVEINTSNYTEKQEVPKSHVEERERIGDKLNQEKVEGIEEATKMELLEEEVQMRSSTLASVQGDTNQILQKETLHVNESEVIQNGTIVQEIEVYETEDNAGRVIENLDNDASEIRAEEGMDAKQLTDLEMSKSETEGVPEDEVMQPISNAVQVRIEAVEESKQESQPKADATDKSNREVLIKKFVTEETAEINTNNYTEEQDTVQTSHANEQEGTMDDEKLHEEEAKGIEEKTKTQFPEEEFQTTSPIPAFIQEDSGQTSQQETLNIDESEVLDNDKQSCIPERELDGKSTVVQETNNPETKDNVSTGADNLDNKDEIEVTAEQGTCVEQLTNVEIPKSETKGVPKDEPLQPIANIVLVRTEAVNEGSQQGIQTQADVTQKSNKDVKTPEYVTAETIEKNTTNYNKEQEKVPSTPAKDEGIKTKFNHKEEANGIEEAAKIQSLEEEVQTKSPTPILIQGDNNQVPYKETLAVDRSEVIDNAKQSCITEIELDGGNSIVVQETEKPETKNNVNIRTRNFEDKDASEIKAEEGSYDKQVTEVERSKSLTEDVPEYEDPTEIEITVVVGAETVNDSNQEQIELDDGTEKKSNKEEQTPKYAADDTAQINTNNYPDEHDKDQTSHAKIKEGIDEEILDQMTKAKATVQSSKMHLPQEEIQTTSLTPAVVQGNTKQISQHELLHVDESEETIDYVKQSCIPEIELERRSTIAQETEKPESNDSISKITEMSATNDATKIRAEEETDSKTLADLKMQNSEIEEDQVRQPIVIITERVDDTKEEQIQLDKDITEKKPNKEEQTKQCVDDDTAEINTTSYTDQHDKVQTSDAEVKQGIEDDENLGRLIEDQATAESSKMQLPREEVLTISLTPACVQIDTEKILQQELLHVDESEGIDYVKQSCKEEIELGRNTTFAQETEKPETKDNNSKVTENSATSDATKVKAVEETDSKSLVNFKTNKSEIEEDQVRQPKGNAVGIVTERVNDTKDEEIQLDEDITQKKPNEEKQTTQCVDEETAEINTTSYTDQHDKVQTSDTEVKQGIEDDENLGPQIEDQATAESSKMQLPKEEVLTLTPASVQMDTEKILQQELLHVDESETIDYVKQSCKEEIELGRNTTFAQETEKPETKDNNSKVTENSATSDATKIKAEEGTDSRTLADFKTDKSEIEDQVRQPIEISIAILTERVDDTKGEQIQLDEDITEKKPNEEEQTTQCVDEDTAEINTTSYIDQHDKVQTSDTEVKQGIEDDENLGPQIEDQATAESSKMQLPKEEVLTLTPASVQMDTEKILQQELLHVDESEAIDYVKQSCIEEIELGRNTTFAQETQKPKTKDSISKVTENLGSINARKIRAEEETYSKTLADFKTRNSEIEEDQVRQPIVIVTERVDDTKEEQIQLDEDITEKKSNEEEQTTQYVAEDTAEIHTTSYIDQHDKVQTSDAEVKQEIENDENFGPQVEDQAIAESSKMKLPKEEVQTRSPSAGFVQHDTDKILQQELLELDQSEVIDYVMQSCIPEIEFDRKSIIAQETEKTETEDNISNVTENLGTNYESKVREEEETDVKKFVDLKMPKSEIAEDELLQTITIAVVVGTETVDDSNQEQMRLEEDITEKKSNREEQTPQYVAEDTAEINTNNYTNEHDKVQTSDAEVKERIEDDEKFGQQEETKGIEETRKIQLLEKEVQTRSPTTAFVQGNSDQILQQELLHVDESEVIDYMKQSSLPEIQLDRKSTVVQETEKLNTKDNVGIVTEKLGTTDARKIRAELADFKMPKSEIEEVPEDEVPQPIAVAVAIRTETIDDINKKQIQLKEDITDKKSNKEQSPQYVVEDTAEINTNSYTDGHDKVQTSHAEVNQGIEGFGQEEEASGLEERNKRQLPKEEVQITSPTPAFVQRDTAQISQQELLHIDESEVIDYVKQSCIQEIELDIKSTTFQETEKPEAKDNVGIVTENIGTNDASEIKEKEETDAENLADLKMAESEIEGVPKEESLKPIPDTVFVENKAVIASQEKRQPQQEFVKKFNKEVQKPQYFTEVSAKIETTNDTEEPEEVPPSQPPKEKSGIKDDGKLEEEQEEKGIEEATKTQLQDKDIRTTLPIHTLIQGHFDQILQQQTLHDDESKGIGNAKKSCTHEMELDRESIIVEEPETKDNVNIIKQEQANNQSEKSSIQRGITDNITAEGLVTLESNRKISDDVCTDEQKTVKSCSTENLDNKNASEIRVEKSSEAKPSTYVEIIESKTQGEPEDKALQTRLNSSSNGNEGLDESSPEDRQTEAEFTENFNKDVQTPQRDTKVTAETNTATYPDKQQEAPASDANEKLGIQDEGKFDQEEAEGIEESIEKLLPEEEIQYTLPTPTSVQGDIDKMSQQQTLHDNEIEAINNAKSCMTEFELDRKSIVVEEPKPETKANVDFVKEEQADHQSEESSVQSFITNYLIVERHMTSESNKESSDDVDLDGHKKEESHLVEFLQIKDASEIRAKGIHTNQLTDIEIQKSETEGVAEDKGMQTMSSTTSGKNYASNECCQEEIQPQEEYVETHIKEVKTPYYEFDMQKQIPEAFGIQEDACQIMAENEKKLKSQLAPPNKETTFIDNLYSDGEIAKTNPINDIEKVVNPKSRTMEKSVIHDDSKFNEEKAKGIEEMAKIKLLDTATDSPQKEVQPKLPAPATVQGDTDQILQHQTLPSDASGIIDNDMRCIPENKLDRMSTVIEEPEIKANINIVEEEQSDKQSQEPSMQSLITEYITEEGHLASESNSKLSYDMNAKTVNLQVVENLGIKYGSKMTVEEVTDARPPRGVEVEKTKNEGVLDFKAKTLTNAELAEHETLYETNQETQPEEEFSGTYSKGKQTPQSSMESVITKHINSEGKEITESSTNSSYDEEEQEQVINTYTIENSEIKDGRKIMLEEASDIKEATDEPVDRAISIISPMSFVRIGIVDESIQEQIQMEVQPAVINTEEDQKPENDFVRNTEILEEFDLKKVSGNTCVENEGKVKVQSEANNQKTIKKHPNLEELETAETSPSSDTKELGKQREVTKLGGVSESVSVDITEHTDMGKLETQETENAISGNTKEDKAGDEFEKISPSSSVDVISRDSQDTGTKVLHKKSNGILSGVGSKVKHSISKVKKVITGKSSRPKTPPSSK
ncbi:hypothetical protein PHAVU_008G154713 [Phaseolus vulgaris]